MKALLLAAVAAAFAGIAFAQDITTPTSLATGDTLVDVNSWYALLQPYLTMIATTLITAAIAWLTAQLSKWTGIQIEGKHRDSFQAALTNGAGLLIQGMGNAAATAKGLNVGNPFVKIAVDYVQRAAPDAIRYFDIGADSIAQKLEAKLGLLTPTGGAMPSIPVSKPPG